MKKHKGEGGRKKEGARAKGYTIFIPVYNEEAIIRENVKELKRYLDTLKEPYEILIVSNGSDDKTEEYGFALARQHPEAVKFFALKEKGVGRALRAGIKEACYSSIITVDMDISIDMGFIGKAMKLLREHDIVIGSKQMGAQQRSFFRRIPSAVFILLTKTLLRMGYADYSIAAKGYRTRVLEQYEGEIDQGSSYVINIIYYSKRAGKKIVEIPVECNDTRKSKFNILHEIVYRFFKLLRLFSRRSKYSK